MSLRVTWLSLWRLSRPETWMVTFLPVIIGHTLAARELVPAQAQWLAALQSMDLALAAAALAASTDYILALAVMGPLIWVPTLLMNDIHDLPGDKVNPRKARSPLVQGIVTTGWAARWAAIFAILAVFVGWYVSPAFAAIVLLNLALAWAYSAPPLRWKTRPGADVAVNALGVGLLSALAGWTIAAPIGEFPWLFAPQGLLVAIAVYVPTTLVDHDADAEVGYATLATHLGRRGAYRIGWWSWVLCNAGAIALSAADIIIPRAMLPILLIFAPLLIGEYHAFIGKAPNGEEMVKGIVLCSFTFLAVNAVFALMYTGIWMP